MEEFNIEEKIEFIMQFAKNVYSNYPDKADYIMSKLNKIIEKDRMKWYMPGFNPFSGEGCYVAQTYDPDMLIEIEKVITDFISKEAD